MKKLKRIVTGVVAVLVAIMVAGYVILSTMDFEDLRETIQAEARAATGRDLIIAGPINLEISLTPAIQLEQVTFANAEWGSRPEMVTLDRFEVEVALIPLFSGDIEVRRLVIVRADAQRQCGVRTGRSEHAHREDVALVALREADAAFRGPFTRDGCGGRRAGAGGHQEGDPEPHGNRGTQAATDVLAAGRFRANRERTSRPPRSGSRPR